jgi:hypothetical protein
MTTLYRVFGCAGKAVCERCSNRHWLPLDAPVSVAVACSSCKDVLLYSVKPDDERPTEADERAVPVLAKFYGGLTCEVGCDQVPLYTLPLSADHQERLTERDSWNWADLKCPDGHRILNPWLRPSEPSVVT